MLGRQPQAESKVGIIDIVNKYMTIIEDLFDETTLDNVGLEEHRQTITHLVPHNFFKDENMRISYCDKQSNVLYKEFGEPFVLFNDLKSSTKILEELEEDRNIHLYAIYMYYSSLFLSEILDFFDGKMVECTGDGNYSIFLYLNRRKIVEEYLKFNKDLRNSSLITREEEKRYLENFDNNELSFRDNYSNFSVETDECLRCLFFKLFTIYNIKFNYAMPSMRNLFLTRVGCVQGSCKITRIENKHIKQDKLIGSAVYKASHQASGKL